MSNLHRNGEKLILLADFAKEISTTYRNVYSMVKNGRLSISGDVIKLESIKVTRGLATSREAWTRFLDKMNP